MRTLEITQGFTVLVDDADYEELSKSKWHVCKRGEGLFYAARNTPDRSKTYMHSVIMPGFKRIDHEDGNGLNNQRHNLRPATHAQNLRGRQRKAASATSKYRGVSWNTNAGKWMAQINVSGSRRYLGLFTDESEAARAYDVAAREHFGTFAAPNFPA